MAKICKAPEEIPGLPKEIENVMGDVIDSLAERKILDHYCRNQSFNQFTSIFPLSNFDGTQIFVDQRGLNTIMFISFLKFNNPRIDQVALAKIATMVGGGIKNPDWMTDSKSRGIFEFYEVKPNSRSGVPKGRDKIVFLHVLSQSNNLPYVPGTRYNPTEEEILWTENRGFITTVVSLRWFRRERGLIVYEICKESKVRATVPKVVVDAVEAAAILAMMLVLIAAAAAAAAAGVLVLT